MKPSPALQIILDLAQGLNEEDFKQAVRDSSIEVKDEYLSYILMEHSKRRFVAEERKRHAERIQSAEDAQRHQQAIDVSRQANRFAFWAIVIAIGAAVIAGVSLCWQWEDRSAAKPKPATQAAAPALLSPAPAVLPPATNATPKL
jgi:hypothetical protein